MILTNDTPAINSPAIVPPQRIELRGIIADQFGLHAIFAAGPSQRAVPVERRDLATFAAFRRRVEEFLEIRIAFAGDWADAVAGAFQRGASV